MNASNLCEPQKQNYSMHVLLEKMPSNFDFTEDVRRNNTFFSKYDIKTKRLFPGKTDYYPPKLDRTIEHLCIKFSDLEYSVILASTF